MINVTAYSTEIGTAQQLEMAQGEDREYRLTFTVSGTAIDMTGATAVVLTVRSRATGALIFARSYSGFQGSSTAGTPRFQILQADTAAYAADPYDVDVTWTDASGYKQQLLVTSTFELLQRVGEPGDPLTTPPAIPVVYGLNWLAGWSTVGTGYQVNDAVTAQDGSLGATSISSFRAIAAGVTYYPVNASLLVATGWRYVAQHGGDGGQAFRYTVGASDGGSFMVPLAVPQADTNYAVAVNMGSAADLPPLNMPITGRGTTGFPVYTGGIQLDAGTILEFIARHL